MVSEVGGVVEWSRLVGGVVGKLIRWVGGVVVSSKVSKFGRWCGGE